MAHHLGEAAAHYRETEPRGSSCWWWPGPRRPPRRRREYTLEEAVELARSLGAGGLSASEAAKEAAQRPALKRGRSTAG